MVTVASEAWLALALLHREQPGREAFSRAEILERARAEGIHAPLRPGVDHHVTWHAVANKRPQGGRHRMLYATGRGERRLFRTGDDFHPQRTGKSAPDAADIPDKYHTLLDWYRTEFDRPRTLRERTPSIHPSTSIGPREFEDAARHALSVHLGVPLSKTSLPGVPKPFDLVSPDRSVVGDATYLTLVRGQALPAAKFSTIAEYVWLLEKTSAPTKLLVFGNDRRVPVEWLRRYGHLAGDVRFYFLQPGGELEDLSNAEEPAQAWSRLSSSAFARDWDSAEDSVYDELPAG